MKMIQDPVVFNRITLLTKHDEWKKKNKNKTIPDKFTTGKKPVSRYWFKLKAK